MPFVGINKMNIDAYPITKDGIILQFLGYLPILPYLSVYWLTSLFQLEVDEGIVGDALVMDIGLIVKQLLTSLLTYLICWLPCCRGTGECRPFRCPCER